MYLTCAASILNMMFGVQMFSNEGRKGCRGIPLNPLGGGGKNMFGDHEGIGALNIAG